MTAPLRPPLRPSTSLLLRRVHSSATTTPPPQSILQTLSSYSNTPTVAFDFFHRSLQHRLLPPDPSATNLLLDILGKSLDFDLLRRTLLLTPHADHRTFRIVFHRYAAAHLVRDAISAFHLSSRFDLLDLTTYHHLIDSLCEHRHAPEAEALALGPDPPFPLDTKIHNMILHGYLKLRHWRGCRNFWNTMNLAGIPKDLHTYSIYMDVLAKCGKPWRAVRLYKEIRKKGVLLDVVAYNTLIRAVGLVDGADCAISMFREMVELGCRPNAATYNTIVKLFCTAERFQDAYAFLDRMRRDGCEPNVITYHCFFGCLRSPGEIVGLFERMLESGCRPRMETYVMLMKRFGKWGFLRPVFRVWEVMEEQGCSPDAFAYNAMINALVQKGMVELARKYDEEMLAKGLSAKPKKGLGTRPLGDAESGDGGDVNVSACSSS